MTTVTVDKHKAYVVGAWGVLMVLTAVSWWLGSDHDMAGLGRDFAMISILLVTIAKIYVVGHAFMELREAAPWLQNLFRGWCLALCTTLCVLYLSI
ncbi:cytochrome C oxidase subunit IV family protein [Mycobacterium palustre]|nr:cytochrome C oxidase subunit IV family protein [Mycobacterium palustre]MCV7099884.1 cytochrome C oxidase subunit IV family protein [Mycobacterium palustre]